jgi:peptidoglycan/LPS O-acetylase OafA/YrhL
VKENKALRKDIQGLRAIAVFAVIIFHCGYLPNGYLGVDIFFVISGFLITGIINEDFLNNNFTLKSFYTRRFRRIIPLVLVVSLFALVLGVLCMLPDDMENLAQSIIATNLFSNNILQYVTTGDYWDVVNEYKPMFHTWSLGVEEQFYLLFPLFFILLKKNKQLIFLGLLLITLFSASLFILSSNEAFKFYMLPTRFFEISIGGLATLKIGSIKKNVYITSISFLIIILTMFFDFSLSNETKVIITVLCTVVFLMCNKSEFYINRFIENKGIVYLGTISFSLYMWHQVLLAFYRYTISQEIDYTSLGLILILTIFISIPSYHFVENYLRDVKSISTKRLLIFSAIFFVIVNGASFWIYKNAGIVRDVPELDLTTENIERGVHAKYNASIYKLNDDFKESDKIKVLIIGNSFARDWANVLLASDYKYKIEISYSFNPFITKNIQERISNADVIFLSTFSTLQFDKLETKFKVDRKKVWIVGTKNFGRNNGMIYNYKGDNYCEQRVQVDEQILVINDRLRKQWGSRYIDLLSHIIDDWHTVPAFTPDCKFISQDSRHLTQAGAKMFASILDLSIYLDLKK